MSARQKILADSINDTARMARAALSLVLLAALYLFLTLISTDDKQLLLGESQIALPQVNIGISIKASYIIGPLIFLYLHVQALFLLGVLAQKIRRFIGPSNRSPITEEYWNWLSAFAFVQLFRPNGNRPWLSLILSCISIAVIPILLLLAVYLSFFRYQSIHITYCHLFILILDIISVIWFIAFIIRLYKKQILRLYKRWIFKFWKVMIVMIVGTPTLIFYVQLPQFIYLTTTYGWKDPFDYILCNWSDWFCRYIDVNNELLIDILVELPDKDIETKKIYVNKLDLAERNLRYACFRSAELHHVDLRSADLRGADFGSAEVHSSDFRGAKLHGANFVDMKLKNGTDFGNAELHGTNLSGAELHNADFRGAKLHGANLSNSEEAAAFGTKECVESSKSSKKPSNGLNSEVKSNTILHGADFRFAELHGANLAGAELHGANLEGAKLHGANLAGAELHGANLRFAKLHGANLAGAELHGANLEGAKLHGANLAGAELHGANLRNAKLHGANLEGVKLDGADLGNAKLAGSFGNPGSWHWVWMLNTSFFFPVPDAHVPVSVDLVYADQLIKKLTEELRTNGIADIQITWKEDISLDEHLQESIKTGKNFWAFDNTGPNDGDMVFYKSYDLLPYGSRPSIPKHKHWPPSIFADDTEYWKTRSEWTIGFACKNEHTARSILKRWMSDTPLSDIRSENLDIARCTIIDALKKKRQESEKRECPGLHAIPDDEWQKFESKYPSVNDCAIF